MNAAAALRTALLTLLLVVLGVGLLYAYRSQAPAIPTVPISQAVQDIQAGRVKIVTEVESKATLDLTDGTKEQTNLPDNAKADPLQDAVTAYNQQNPTRPIALRYEAQSTTWTVIGSVLLSLLPVFLIAGFFVMLARGAMRGVQPDRAAQLERLATLRDRGVLTEDEFQKEKRRVLK